MRRSRRRELDDHGRKYATENDNLSLLYGTENDNLDLIGLGSFKPVTAEGAEVGFVVNEGAKSGKALDVALGMKPEFHITAFRVFLVQMSEGTLVKGFEIGFGKHFAAIRHGSMDDRKRVNLPIGFCNDGTIDSTRRVLAAGTMVFDCIAHGVQLFGCEEPAQGVVRHEDLTGMDMMVLAVDLQAQIMVRGNDICHGLVGVVSSCEFETFADDRFGMITSVGTIESIVLRKDRLMDIDVQSEFCGVVDDTRNTGFYQGLSADKSP